MWTFIKKIDWMPIVTLLLFIATLALVCVTRQLVIGAETTSKAQLRAYVLFESGAINCQFKGCIGINVRNSGQTPAYDLTCYLTSAIRDPLEPQVDWSVTRKQFRFEQTGDYSIDLGPNHPVPLDFCQLGPTVSGLKPPSGKAIYVWGDVKYRDFLDRCEFDAFIAQEDGGFHYIWEYTGDPTGKEHCDGKAPERSIYPLP